MIENAAKNWPEEFVEKSILNLNIEKVANDSKPKPKWLSDCRPLDIHTYSYFSEVTNCIDELWLELRKKNKNLLPTAEINVYKYHLKMVVVDLYHRYVTTNGKGGIGYNRNKNAWSIDSRYNKLNIKRKPLLNVIDSLSNSGFIEHVNGYKNPDTGKGYNSKIRAKRKLLNFIDRFKVSSKMIERAEGEEVIILSSEINGKKSNVHYEDNEHTYKMRNEINLYKELLSKHKIECPGYTFTASDNTKAKRIFNGDFDKGGRLYAGWWQYIPSKHRPNITIDGEYTVELDYRNYQIRIMYAFEGVDYEEDGYHLAEHNTHTGRKLLKKMLLSCINAKDKLSAQRAIQNEINNNKDLYNYWDKRNIKVSELIEQFEQKHKLIGDYFYSEKGLALQRIDSNICMDIIMEFVRQSKPILTIHDSFIVREEDQELLKNVMTDKFQKQCKIKVKNPDTVMKLVRMKLVG